VTPLGLNEGAGTQFSQAEGNQRENRKRDSAANSPIIILEEKDKVLCTVNDRGGRWNITRSVQKERKREAQNLRLKMIGDTTRPLQAKNDRGTAQGQPMPDGGFPRVG